MVKVELLRHRETVERHTFRRKVLDKERRKLLKQLGIKKQRPTTRKLITLTGNVGQGTPEH